MLLLVQSFGLQSPGGGPRILRSLLVDAPVPFLSVCTTPTAPPPVSFATEIHLPLRPYLKDLEKGRLHRIWWYLEQAMVPHLESRLIELARREKVTAIHGLSQSMDFWSAFGAAKKLGVPFYLTVHDDLRHNYRGYTGMPFILEKLGIAWREAVRRFVISNEMGQEYNRRFGERAYSIITDGLEKITPPRPVDYSSELHLYFMGLFHFAYSDNLNALIEAIMLLKKTHRYQKISLTMRCGALSKKVRNPSIVNLFPFGSQEDVEADMLGANLLYLPLQFGKSDEFFYRFSLSTKMITYLGSGLPILFHGTKDSAAYRLLEKHNAAILLDNLEPQCIAQSLAQLADVETVVRNAQRLGRESFDLARMRDSFWSQLQQSVS